MKERLKIVRKALGLKQKEIAEAIGVSQVAYSQYETGVRVFQQRYVKALEREFGVNPNWLQSGEGEMFLQSSREDEFVKKFFSLSEENQKLLMRLMENLKAEQES